MKSLLPLFMLFFPAILIAQDFIEPDGGGEFVFENGECLSPSQRLEIQKRIDENRIRLGLDQVSSEAAVTFSWPMKQAAGFKYFDVYAISAHVDHDPASGSLLDYYCGQRTYDLSSGYNHQGTDIFTWPFGWNMMTNDQAEVVAAAPGTIISKDDGNFDRNCGLGTGNWNAVYIQHSDGSVAWYGHMKKSSLTSKTIGQTVVAGEFLGIVGSSGSSTGPHLHLEVYDKNNNLNDPFSGSCNSMNANSWWTNQEPYYNSRINALMTHTAPPVTNPCPDDYIINDSNCFVPNSTFYVAAYYRDQLSGQVSEYKIFQPDNTLWVTWNQSSTTAHYSASYYYYSRTVPANPQFGKWKFEVTFNGKTYDHEFRISADCEPISTVGIEKSSTHSLNVYPNPTEGDFTINLGAPKDFVEVIITDIQAQVVYTNNYLNTQIIHLDQSELPEGIYFVSVTGSAFSEKIKLVKK